MPERAGERVAHAPLVVQVALRSLRRTPHLFDAPTRVIVSIILSIHLKPFVCQGWWSHFSDF